MPLTRGRGSDLADRLRYKQDRGYASAGWCGRVPGGVGFLSRSVHHRSRRHWHPQMSGLGVPSPRPCRQIC